MILSASPRRMFAKKSADSPMRLLFPVFPARLPAIPDGQTAPQTALSREPPKIRRANSEALLPRRGKQRRIRTPAAYPCPAGQGCIISPPPFLPPAFKDTHPCLRPVSRRVPPQATKKAKASSLQRGRKPSRRHNAGRNWLPRKRQCRQPPPFYGAPSQKRRPFAHPHPPKNAASGKPLLVGLPPSTPTIAPTEPKRSTPTLCSWGGRAVLRASSRCKGKGRGGSLRRCLAPQGQGALPVCGVDAVCPCGAKALQSGAPDFGWFAGESCLRSGLPFKNGLVGAPGERKRAVLRSMRPPRPRNHPAGGTAGSARTRSRDSSLENPFLGDGLRFPAAPVP